MKRIVYWLDDGSGDQAILEVPNFVDPPNVLNLKHQNGFEELYFDLEGEMDKDD